MTKQNLTDCHKKIAPYIKETPVLTSNLINKLCDADVYFKCENFQKTGSYKIRGATNAILNLSDETKKKGVITHSSGNFAQALSLAAKNLEVNATIVMPSNAPKVKKNAVLEYKGNIIECEPTNTARQSTADKIGKATGANFIHPSNDLDVILGQGTACLELIKKNDNLDAIFCPVGGGGLIAGSCLAVNYFSEKTKIYGAEPFEADDAYRSLKSGKIETNDTTNTIADGLRTNLGDKNFPIIKEYVQEIFRVTEDEIIEAMKLIFERMKIVIEPSSAVTVAAFYKNREQFKGKRIGIIISGGNIDVNNLPF